MQIQVTTNISRRDVANVVCILAAIGAWYLVYHQAVLVPARLDRELEVSSAAADRSYRDLHATVVMLFEERWEKEWGHPEKESSAALEKKRAEKREFDRRVNEANAAFDNRRR